MQFQGLWTRRSERRKQTEGEVETSCRRQACIDVARGRCRTRRSARLFISRSPRMAIVAPLGFRALPHPLAQLSLAAVLKCGQSFRWSIYPLHPALPSDPSHEYRLCLQDRVVCLRQSPDTLFYRSVFPESTASPEVETARDAETLLWLKDYFQLDVDLVKLYDEWSEKDHVFAKLRGRFEGIRMLRQDPWENLISCASRLLISSFLEMLILSLGS